MSISLGGIRRLVAVALLGVLVPAAAADAAVLAPGTDAVVHAANGTVLPHGEDPWPFSGT